MSHRQKSAVGGAALGGVAGAVITNGGILGTVGGAAIGGVIGDQVGKR
jgi:osmotically inducible lipoprotein OsmB